MAPGGTPVLADAGELAGPGLVAQFSKLEVPFPPLFAISVLIFLSYSLGLVQRGNMLIGCGATSKDAMYARIYAYVEIRR